MYVSVLLVLVFFKRNKLAVKLLITDDGFSELIAFALALMAVIGNIMMQNLGQTNDDLLPGGFLLSMLIVCTSLYSAYHAIGWIYTKLQSFIPEE
jgi:hypothetical protein